MSFHHFWQVMNLRYVIVYAEAQEQRNDFKHFVKFHRGTSRKQGFPQSDPVVLKYDSNTFCGDPLCLHVSRWQQIFDS